MAGRLINSRNVQPFLNGGYYHSGFWYYNAIDEEIKDCRALERFSDDPPEAGSSVDLPYLFSDYLNNRYYFLKHFEDRKSEFRSIYRCLKTENHCTWRHYDQPWNCIILLISDGKLAIGYYKEGKLVAKGQVAARQDYDGSQKSQRFFLLEVSTFLKTWQERFDEAEVVFVRCSQVHYYALFDSLKELEKEKYRHIPFVTCPPSIEEIQRVHSRLFSCVHYGNVKQTLAELQQERKAWKQAETTRMPEQSNQLTKSRRKAEKQQFPWLDARTAAEIEEAVGRNDGDRLEELLSGKRGEIRDYLNEPRLNGGRTLLHYAVREDAVDSMEVLLEFGADPTVTDGQNRVPFEYCQGEKMEDIFIKFREENEDNFEENYWNKAKIPVERIIPVKEKQKEEFDKRAARDKLRSQRRQKLDKRRVKIED